MTQLIADDAGLKHSPLPWTLATGGQDSLKDANGNFVTYIDGPNFLIDEANGRLIVTAVNSHARLLAAAKAVISKVDADDFTNSEIAALDALEAAIAAAEVAS